MATFETEQQADPAVEQQSEQVDQTTEQQPEASTEQQADPAAEVKSVSADTIKEGLALAGKDVSGVWDDVVKFAEASVDDFETAGKKALEWIGHEAVFVWDAVVALAKHK